MSRRPPGSSLPLVLCLAAAAGLACKVEEPPPAPPAARVKVQAAAVLANPRMEVRETAPVAAVPAPAAPAAPAPAAPPFPAGMVVDMAVTADGYVPNKVAARAGQPITFRVTRKTDKTCAKEIIFQGDERKTNLPLDKTVTVVFTPTQSGEIRFGCHMGMMVSGTIVAQ